MDENLRRLRRAAKAGDTSAALQYFYAAGRARPRQKFEVPAQRYDLTGVLQGPVNIRPISGTHLNFASPGLMTSTPQVIHLNEGAAYVIDCNYYYYDDLGWIPNEYSAVDHARQHYQRNQEQEDGAKHPLRWYLTKPERRSPRTQATSACIICGEFKAGTTFHVRQVNQHGTTWTIGVGAAKLINKELIKLCNQFAKEHPDLMHQAELADLNESLMKLAPKVEEQREILARLESTLAQLIIEELRLED